MDARYPDIRKELFASVPEKQHTAVVIPAHNCRNKIGATVRAAIAIPTVDLVVVVDDGSSDDTARVARSAGAATVRHSIQRGRSSAMETGAKVAAMRDRADWPPRHILFLDADLGDSAIEGAGLVSVVNRRLADCASAVMSQLSPEWETLNARAWRVVRSITGWDARLPLATQRCISREALNAIMPFRPGWGVDLGIALDLVIRGFSVVEVDCQFQHQSPVSEKSKLNVALLYRKYWDIWATGLWYRLTRQRVPLRERIPLPQQKLGQPYARLNAEEIQIAQS